MFFHFIFCHPTFYPVFPPLLFHVSLEAHADVVVAEPEVSVLAFTAASHSPDVVFVSAPQNSVDIVVLMPSISSENAIGPEI